MLIWTLILALGWAAMALVATGRSDAELWRLAAIVTGIPLLGLITLLYGPWAGLLGLVAGLAMLLRPLAHRPASTDPE